MQTKISNLFDWKLAFLMLAISSIGLLILYSAGYDSDAQDSYSMKAQMFNIAIGMTAFLVCAFIRPSFWKRWSPIVYSGGCILLLLVFIIGVAAGGARRWLDLGFIRLQPSEVMKIGIILAMANVLSSEKAPRNGYGFVDLIWPGIVILVPAAMILIQPDLGTATSLCMVGFSMLLIAGVQFRVILTLALTSLIALVPAWTMLEEYQKNRIRTFLSPELDPMGIGYHAIQSKIAVGSGGLFGKGILEGTQTQLRFLPEQTTDFIFSVLAEEWGLIGAIVLIALYALLVARLCKLGVKAPDTWGSFVAFGVASYIFWHAFVNIGMVIGILPVVGITLPLVSYGGTSIISFMTAIGLAAGAVRKRYLFS